MIDEEISSDVEYNIFPRHCIVSWSFDLNMVFSRWMVNDAKYGSTSWQTTLADKAKKMKKKKDLYSTVSADPNKEIWNYAFNLLGFEWRNMFSFK